MKLEAGKKYLLRNGGVAECIAVWTKQVDGRQATILWAEDQYDFCLDGRQSPTALQSNIDVVAEYKQPKKIGRWLKLYDNGEAFGYVSIDESKTSITLAEHEGRARLVETRYIEWEVPDNGLS